MIEKLFVAFFGATVCAALLSAQSSTVSSSSKVTVKEGKDVTVVGCIEQTTEGTGFVLKKVADKHGALRDYVLVPDHIEDVASHVGHLVEIKGKATDRGDAKVEFETRTQTESHHGDDERHAKTKMKGDLPNLAYLGVRSVKLIAAACP